MDNKTLTVTQAANMFRKLLDEMPTADEVSDSFRNVEFLSTGLPAVDHGVLGLGGLPFGYGIELFGLESSGKTLFAIHMAAMLHARDPEAFVLWCDVEGSHVPAWMSLNGMNLSRTKIAHGLGSAEHYEGCIRAAISGGYRMIVLDSASSMVPEEVMSATTSNLKMNQQNEQAAFMTNMLHRLESGWPEAGLPSFASTRCMFIIINHSKRMNIEDSYRADSKGAGAIKHFCRVRLNIESMSLLRDDKGDRLFKTAASEGVVRIQCIKNQLGLPLCESTYHVNLRTGQMWDDPECIIELGKRQGTLTVTGSWYNHGKMRWQGKDALMETIRKLPELGQRICRGKQ